MWICILLLWWENSRQVNQIQRQPGEMIVRSVEIDKDLRIVLIFFCRDPLDCRGGQTRALVTGCCAWWSQIYLKTDRFVWNSKRIVKVNSFWQKYNDQRLHKYNKQRNQKCNYYTNAMIKVNIFWDGELWSVLIKFITSLGLVSRRVGVSLPFTNCITVLWDHKKYKYKLDQMQIKTLRADKKYKHKMDSCNYKWHCIQGQLKDLCIYQDLRLRRSSFLF